MWAVISTEGETGDWHEIVNGDIHIITKRTLITDLENNSLTKESQLKYPGDPVYMQALRAALPLKVFFSSHLLKVPGLKVKHWRLNRHLEKSSFS